jgi:hypothetical protein
MTQNHVLPAGTCSLSPSLQSALLPLVYASQISVGDCIMTVAGQERVAAVEKVRGEGVYTVVTNEVISEPCFALITFPFEETQFSSPFIVSSDWLSLPSNSSHPFLSSPLLFSSFPSSIQFSFSVLSSSLHTLLYSNSSRPAPQEYLVVNGIIASPFGVNHMMGNLYYNIHRLVYAFAPVLLSYTWLIKGSEVSQRSQ